MTSLGDELEKKLQEPYGTPFCLPLEFLRHITNNFSPDRELGRGQYGVVYKGVLRSGKIIAVKKLSERSLVEETFLKQVNYLMRIKHQHIVQFIGYCTELRLEMIEIPRGSGKHIVAEIRTRILCFEYVSNRSLDKYISDESSGFEWNTRYEIIKGICSGLNFLHEECGIIHMNLQPTNILLDHAMIPKIADIALGTIFDNKQFHTTGTIGYMAPEYIIQRKISKKADIFSLGVMIIEIITGCRDYPYFELDSPEHTATSCKYFIENVLMNWRYKFKSTIKLMEKYNQQVKQCITIAIKCVDLHMERRPTANEVIQELNIVEQMEASKEMPFKMKSNDKLLVLDPNLSKESIPHIVTQEMSNIETSGTVGNVKKSQECLLPTPLWTSSTSSQNHQEAATESSEPEQASDKTSEAMVSASTGAMNSVLFKLATLLEDERNPRTRNNIIALRCALASMRSFLERRATSTEHMGPLVEGWMKQVRDMTFDLEDYIDDFICSAALGDTKSIWFLNHRAAQLLKMVTRRRQTQYMSLLQELKEQVSEASERRWRYGIVCDLRDPMPIQSDAVPINGLRPILSAHGGGGLVCVEGPRDRLLIKLLSSDDQQKLKMVSIVGPRGIGKTTLVMEVYQILKKRFHCHTVVSVSRRHDLRMILLSILSQIGVQEHDFGECDEEQLIHKLREFLKTRRYFIVIEDIWDASAWKIIRWAFPENDRGSRILVTTCIISIASPSCYFSEDHILQMTPLDDADARRLFFRRIFHPEYRCPLHLEEISSDVLKKCGGVPLAIFIIASLLATKSEESEWKRVRDGIGSIVDKSATLEGIKQILHFAYFDLPVHLRTCLLYLTIFREGYVIDKARLIRRWMAEGFINEVYGRTSEEVGELYFTELIIRGFIQPVCIQYDGQIKACQVQNMIFDIMLSKSAEENFVTRYDDQGSSFGVQNKIRRLSFYCDYDKEFSFVPSAETASHIRSLTICTTDKEMPTLANFRALRVLDLESRVELKDANYLQNIGKPCLLKYLRLQTTRFIELPEQVGELQFLQTMDLSCARITRLPCSIIRLNHLTSLLVKDVKLPDGIGELHLLQELSHVDVESSNSPNSLNELGRLTMLRVLGLNWCISDTTTTCTKICAAMLISIDKLSNSNLRTLHIGSGSDCSLDFLLAFWPAPCKHLQEFRVTSNYYFPRVPYWMTSLVSLKLLEINIDTLGEEVLEILGKLPFLLVLLLSVKSIGPSQGLIITSYGFQLLKQFNFICSSSLYMAIFEQGSMLALEKLYLKFSAKGVPHFGFHFDIEHIASLRYFHVDIDCEDAYPWEVEAAEDAIRGAISAHPGNPRLELQRLRR